MRTTKAQQAKSHRLIIRTAVDLMTQHGFEGTTMKQIARAAQPRTYREGQQTDPAGMFGPCADEHAGT